MKNISLGQQFENSITCYESKELPNIIKYNVSYILIEYNILSLSDISAYNNIA